MAQGINQSLHINYEILWLHESYPKLKYCVILFGFGLQGLVILLQNINEIK